MLEVKSYNYWVRFAEKPESALEEPDVNAGKVSGP